MSSVGVLTGMRVSMVIAAASMMATAFVGLRLRGQRNSGTQSQLGTATQLPEWAARQSAGTIWDSSFWLLISSPRVLSQSRPPTEVRDVLLTWPATPAFIADIRR